MLEIEHSRPFGIGNGILFQGLAQGDFEMLCQLYSILGPQADGISSGAAGPAPFAAEENVTGHAGIIGGGVLRLIGLREDLPVREHHGPVKQKGHIFWIHFQIISWIPFSPPFYIPFPLPFYILFSLPFYIRFSLPFSILCCILSRYGHPFLDCPLPL